MAKGQDINPEDFTSLVGAVFEPNTDHRTFALNNWQFYQAHIQQGFTPEQAMQLVAVFVTCLFNNQTPPQS